MTDQVVTLTREAARALIDALPEDERFGPLVEALDHAQGHANEQGKDETIEIVIQGATL